MYDFTTLFSYPVVNGDATYGELVTASKLTDISKRARDNLVEVLADMYRGASGARRSGVLTGLAPTVSTTKNMTVMVGEGCGLYYASLLFATTAVTTGGTEIALEDPDTTNPRYDLIVARPDGALGDIAVRQVKLSDGTFSTASKPGRYQEGCTLEKFTGTPAGSPTVPSCSLGDIPIAVVYVPSAASPGIIDPANVHDVRAWLAPRMVLPSLTVRATTDGSGAVTATSVDASSPGIVVLSALARSAEGVYGMTVKTPRALGSIVASNWFSACSVQATAYYGGGSVGVLIAQADSAATSPDDGTTTWTISLLGFVPPSTANDVISGVINLVLTFHRAD